MKTVIALFSVLLAAPLYAAGAQPAADTAAPAAAPGETKYATLLIDTRKGTFQCANRTCSAHRGGSLVDFFALLQGMPSYLQAAFALGKFVDLEFDEGLLRQLGEEFVQEGRQALTQGRLEEAGEAVMQALEVVSENIDIQLLASQLAHARGSFGEALEHAQRAAAIAEQHGDIHGAIGILKDRVLALLPGDEETLLHLSKLCDAIGDAEGSQRIASRRWPASTEPRSESTRASVSSPLLIARRKPSTKGMASRGRWCSPSSSLAW